MAATLYVSPASPAPAPPYGTWASAAASIQDAVDAAAAGDEVVVTNGVYQTGGRAVFGLMTNRVAVTKPLTVRSVNGARFTTIVGAPAPGGGNGNGAVRCVFLASNAVLSGFTLTDGHTRSTGDAVKECSGGGVWCEPGATVRNSILKGNSAASEGGGVHGGTLQNCELTDNSAGYGGGAHGSLLLNCTVVGNHSTSRLLGGGVARATCINTIVHLNDYSGNLANYSESSFSFSCTAPAPSGGTGNLASLPAFVDPDAGIFRLQCGSAGIDAGTNLAALFSDDLRGIPRPADGDGDGSAAFDMGAYERHPVQDAADLGIRAAFSHFALRFPAPFFGQVDGCASQFWWDFGDGMRLTNQNPVVHGWEAPGTYEVRLTAQFPFSGLTGVATAVVQVLEANYYVNASNPTPVPPYSTWATAATNIQDAVDAGTALGRLVLVTNGVYEHGGRALHGLMTNRVALTNGVRLQSVHGPQFTLIVGSAAASGGTGDGAVRCVYADKLSIVDGFTLTNGHTLESQYADTRLFDGGGLWCEPGATITNCVITRNFADFHSGGAHQGNLYNCLVSFNSAYYGGGASYAALVNCLIVSNGTYSAEGGGAIYCTLTNCTVAGNAAPWWTSSGGVKGCSVYNSILYYNSPGNIGGIVPTVCSHTCSTPLPAGPGNLEAEPRFRDLGAGNFRLAADSPCINAGKNALSAGGTDLEGGARIEGGTVDLGAYELPSPASRLSYDWARQHGFPTDGSADTEDADRDGMDNWSEWVAGTNPTNVASLLVLLPPCPAPSGGVAVTWQSVDTRTYYLERGSDLGSTPLLPLKSNIVGQAGSTTFTDATATNPVPYFYRVGVQ